MNEEQKIYLVLANQRGMTNILSIRAIHYAYWNKEYNGIKKSRYYNKK